MGALNDTRATIAAKLTAAGIPATLDPRQPPPCVLIDLPQIVTTAGIGGWGCEIDVVALAVPPGGVEAAAWLLDTAEMVLRTLGPALGGPGRYDPAGKDLPAFTLTYPTDVPNPDC